MDCKEAVNLFEKCTQKSVADIKRCGVGIANYVFIISTQSEKYVLRCRAEKEAYKETICCLKKLSVCDIPIPVVLAEGKYNEYEYVILNYIEGDDIGNVYHLLSENEKRQIAKEVIAIQKKVSKIPSEADVTWNWYNFVTEILTRADNRISQNNYFDVKKVDIVRKVQAELKNYLYNVKPVTYLDDISTKNLLINEGKVSGIIDIDWLEPGDMLTFIAMTRVALLNMESDTKYVDYLLDEIKPDEIEYKAYIFYCLMFCVDFMGERGMQFLDKIVPVNEKVIERLNCIFDDLIKEWNQYC